MAEGSGWGKIELRRLREGFFLKWGRSPRAIWIKTCESDKLPPILEDVLVAVRVDGSVDLIDMAFWDGSTWRVSGLPECKIEPLAWMFLPKFPDGV